MYVPADYANVSFVYGEAGGIDIGTEPYVWTLGIKNDSVNDWPDVANEICTIWQTEMAPETSTAFSLDHVDLLVSAGGTATGVVTSSVAAVDGTRTGADTFAAFPAKIRKVTGRLGRKGRGLAHPPGLIRLSEMTNSGVITGSRVSEIETLMTDFGTALFTAGYVGYLLHTDAADGDPDLITGFQVSSKCGVLRRRMA